MEYKNSIYTTLTIDIKNYKEVNLDEYKNLIYLNVKDSFYIKKLDLSKNTKLEDLRIYNDKIKNLDLSKNINLKKLYIYCNYKFNLDLKNNINLTSIWGLKKMINLSNNINLLQIHFSKLFDSDINLSKSNKLIYLGFEKNFNKNITIPSSINSILISNNNNNNLINKIIKNNNIISLAIFNSILDIKNLPINLKELRINNHFGNINLKKSINLTDLTFKNILNNEIIILPENLINLTIENYCIQELTIPLNLKYLKTIKCNNQYIIDNLHHNIIELIVDDCDLNLDNLPNSIKKLTVIKYKKELNNLPYSIENLELENYKLKIKKIPKNLKTIKCNDNYKFIDDFKNFEIEKIPTYDNVDLESFFIRE